VAEETWITDNKTYGKVPAAEVKRSDTRGHALGALAEEDCPLWKREYTHRSPTENIASGDDDSRISSEEITPSLRAA
jgi:hypothetical protein